MSASAALVPSTTMASVNWSSLGVIVPLYIYPVSSDSWAPLTDALDAHPTTPFYVIVNPNSGPGPVGSQPDESYRSALTLLKSRPNAKLIGYVATRYGARAASQVQADVLTYARWDAKWRVAGIFYDEAPNGSEEGQADLLNLYAGYVNYARRVMGRSVQVVLNPGTGVTSPWMQLKANQVVTFEQAYAQYSLAAIKRYPRNSSLQSIMIHSLPPSDSTTTTASRLSSIVSALKKRTTADVASVFVTDLQLSETDVYAGWGSEFAQLADTVAG